MHPGAENRVAHADQAARAEAEPWPIPRPLAGALAEVCPFIRTCYQKRCVRGRWTWRKDSRSLWTTQPPRLNGHAGRRHWAASFDLPPATRPLGSDPEPLLRADVYLQGWACLDNRSALGKRSGDICHAAGQKSTNVERNAAGGIPAAVLQSGYLERRR